MAQEPASTAAPAESAKGETAVSEPAPSRRGKAASSKPPPKAAVKYSELFRYATFADKVALAIALLAALINGGIFREFTSRDSL